jgi:hypothetical protein
MRKIQISINSKKIRNTINRTKNLNNYNMGECKGQ